MSRHYVLTILCECASLRETWIRMRKRNQDAWPLLILHSGTKAWRSWERPLNVLYRPGKCPLKLFFKGPSRPDQDHLSCIDKDHVVLMPAVFHNMRNCTRETIRTPGPDTTHV